MLRWISYESHTHTVHSDATYTYSDLVNAAHKAQLDAFALTDHNTNSGCLEIAPGQVDPYVVNGIEWTTFYGHVVITGPEHFVEFRDLTEDNLDSHLVNAHKAGALVQMAHPYVPGEPFCCGCHWDFRIADWHNIDTIEVWSEGNPDLASWNSKAYEVWQEKLGAGIRLVAMSARDWHEDCADSKMAFGVNYLLINDTMPMDEAIKDAIRCGRAYMTYGPTVDFRIGSSTLGGEVDSGVSEISVSVSDRLRKEIWGSYCLEPTELVVVNNGERTSYPFEGYGVPLRVKQDLQKGYVFVELRGKANGAACKLALTNPIYIY